MNKHIKAEEQGLLLVVSGPSGAGKGTICKAFMEKNPEVMLSISSTTRNPRPGELAGVSYHFVTKDEFERMIIEDKLLEHVHVFDNYYGTSKEAVVRSIIKGEDVLLEIEIIGAMKVKQKYPKAILVFVLPPTMEELKHRIIERGSESMEQINERMERSMEEIRAMEHYDYFIINDQVDKAVEQLESILKSEKNKVSRHMNTLIEKYENEMSTT